MRRDVAVAVTEQHLSGFQGHARGAQRVERAEAERAERERAAAEQARARALEVVDGLEMLVGQAAIAFELFFGIAPPDDEENTLRALLLK